ncbi:HEPN domain-containing protein [Lyngbya sp. PCC 8106]|uniref:ApeA N-terminal domain 1-containing protein n=1 Tax=Lyngbya sp. (strain PCC 8106) TaxID=313612 RepID=UPI0000EAAB5A|nr:HEPN domain-containing protein [Lyngbya sp. PCC 8106]EAW33339.1 hypothetical protein L8106_02887 [Lyngbya sp. PCC 8106]
MKIVREDSTVSEVKYQGQWWFPDNSDKKFLGVLTLNNNQRPILEILEDLHTIPRSKLIHGLAEGEYFTLFDCEEVGVSIQRMDIAKKSMSTTRTYYVSRCIKNSLINNKFEAIKFTSALLSYTFSSSWGNTSKVIKADQENDTFKFECEQGKNKTYNTSIGAITIYQESILKRRFNEISWKSESYIKVRFIKPQSFEETHHKVIYLLQNFLTLATNKPNYPTNVKLELEDKQDSFIQLINFYLYNEEISSQIIGNNITLGCEFSYIQDRFQKIMDTWIKLNKIASDPINIYFFTQYYSKGYSSIENQFLSLVQVIEGYHKIVINPRNKSILKHRIADFLKRYKHYCYNLFKSSAMIIQKNEDDFAELIKDTRNYYSHLGTQNKTLLSQEQILECRDTLKLLFRVCLLEKLDFDYQDIKNILILTR